MNLRNYRIGISASNMVAGFCVAVALAVLPAERAEATLMVVDNGTTLTTTWDETFTLTRDMDAGGIVHGIVFSTMFADTFTAGNPQNAIYDMRASVNGGADIVLSPWAGWNYRIGEDSPGNGWSCECDLGLLWDPNTLGGALAGDTVHLFGSMTHDKGGFHHLPDFGATTVTFDTYNAAPFSATQLVSKVPEPASLALLGIGLAGFGYSRRRAS